MRALATLLLGCLVCGPAPAGDALRPLKDLNLLSRQFYFCCPADALDRGRYDKLVPDQDGVVVFPSLIPGAPYKWVTADPKGLFAGPPRGTAVSVKPGETTDLGDVMVSPLEPPK